LGSVVESTSYTLQLTERPATLRFTPLPIPTSAWAIACAKNPLASRLLQLARRCLT
jgi:hypothetical protein